MQIPSRDDETELVSVEAPEGDTGVCVQDQDNSYRYLMQWKGTPPDSGCGF